MKSFVRTTLNPAMYHGFGKEPPYFEGWYFKLINETEDQRLAIIPGVILGENGHAFIQILNGVSGHSTYHTFPMADFWSSKERFELRIANSYFTNDRIALDLKDEQGLASGELRFDVLKPWPVRWFSPGIMGWYAWVPRMECYHGVLSFDHQIDGEILIDNVRYDFNGGRGYIEKDWGQSFPSAWVWYQTNHFDAPGTSLTASVAIIPWLKSSFRGFIVGFWHQEVLYRFATYTGAKIEHLAIGDHAIDWVISDSKFRLEMHAQQAAGGVLLGPTKIEMGKRVDETLSATIDVRLSHKAGTLIYQGTGNYGGLEVNGELDRLLVIK